MARRNQSKTARENTGLDARLSDYTLGLRASTTPGKSHGRAGNWPIYAAAASSALAMATNASASIIYFGQGDNYHNTHTANLPVPQILASKYLASNGGNPFAGVLPLEQGGPQIGLFASASASFGEVGLRSGGTGKLHIFVSAQNGSFAKKFGSGTLIGPAQSSAFRAAVEIARFGSTGGQLGNFSAGKTGFAGLAVTDGSHNVTEYGWIRLEVSNGQNGFPDELQLIDWAFDTSGAPIAAGEEATATPEPGTMALGLLASGALGVAALRRRRLKLAAAI
jgi:hypothetical protein